MMFLVVYVTWLGLSFVRLVRWAAVIQQKEYRWDRLMAFVRTPEGVAELSRLFWQPHDFTRTGFKRPKPTPRILTVMALVLALAGGLLWAELVVIGSLSTSVITLGAGVVVAVIAVFILIPVLYLCAIAPTVVIRQIVLLYTVHQASALLRNSGTHVIGITGSYGKTSTKLLLQHVLAQRYSVFATPHSYNALLSVARSICSSFAKQEIAILEYGAYREGEIAQLVRWFPPHQAIVTGFTNQHLGLFGSRQAIIRAKAELVAGVPDMGIVFYYGDTPGVQDIVNTGLKYRRQRKKQGFSQSPVLLDYASLIHRELRGIGVDATGRLHFTWQGTVVQTHLVGFHYTQTCAGVIAVCRAYGMSAEEITDGLASFIPSAEFVRSVVMKDGTVVLDDGLTCNSAGFTQMIKLAQAISSARKKILVFGGIVDLGAESEAEHTRLAKLADATFDSIFYTTQVGYAEYAQVCGPKCVRVDTLTPIVEALGKGTLLVLEGKMPGWMVKYLQVHRGPLVSHKRKK